MTDEFDDSLEVGMAAGLDVPTAMALADKHQVRRANRGSHGWCSA